MIRLALAMCGATSATAQEYVVTYGPVEDNDFYALVACAAPPGEACRKPMLYWPPEVVSALDVYVSPPPANYLPHVYDAILGELHYAVDQINFVGSAAQMALTTDASAADIVIHFTLAWNGQPVHGTGVAHLDGQIIGAGLVTVHATDTVITSADLVFPSDLSPVEARSVVLEELTQALGLLTDIRNPMYMDLSIFSQDSNSVTTFSRQDRLAILRHYPPQQ